jgi:hypothetical protein
MSLTGVLLGGSLALLVATAHAKAHGLPPGTWGGDRAILVVSEQGGEIDFECANGRIREPITPDGDGGFDVKGTFAPQHAGPTRDDDVDAEPVRYKGRIEKETMSLTVVRKDESLGPFELTRDRRTNLRKCR